MSRVVTIPEELYYQLEMDARRTGQTIEQAFEEWVHEALEKYSKDKQEGERPSRGTEERANEQGNRS